MQDSKHRILVVDDVNDNLFLMKTFLESEGYAVDVASTASSAIETMELAQPDLLLLDVMMPQMNGYELTRKIRRSGKYSALPIVLITAHAETCRIKGLAVGATDFIRKPINLEALLFTIQNLLKARVKQKES